MDLVQVKAHDIRAFAASKAFYRGVSVDQIMQACHWKAHNTFTNFYLKDLTWSDNKNNMYLGPVAAAPQVLDPSLQTNHPWKENKVGAHPLQPSLQESKSQGVGIRLPPQHVGKVFHIFAGRLFVKRRKSGSASSAFCFPCNSVTVGRILFKFGRCMQ